MLHNKGKIIKKDKMLTETFKSLRSWKIAIVNPQFVFFFLSFSLHLTHSLLIHLCFCISGIGLPLPHDSNGCLHCMWTQTCFPLSPALHPFFCLPSLPRVPHRKHFVSHSEQRSFFSMRANCHTRMCTHTSSYVSKPPQRGLCASTQSLTNARLQVGTAPKTEFPRAALVI